MNFDVNLLPESISQSRRRSTRSRRWIAVCATIAAACGGTWTLRLFTERSDDQAFRKTIETQKKCADAAAEAVQVRTRLAQLKGDLEELARLSRPDRWTSRYALLAATAPEGVVLKELSIQPGPQAATQPAPAAKGAAGSAAAVSAPAASPSRFRILGWATDHGQVMSLVSALQRLPGCRDVELIGAAADTHFPQYAVRFECSGFSEEGAP
ncbi:MAG: hypothetical protein U1D55_17485 [Phycisphaerae bacterium]